MAHITTITVDGSHAGNHPVDPSRKIRCGVSLTAVLDKGDNPDEEVRQLQSRAEVYLQQHVEVAASLGRAQLSGSTVGKGQRVVGRELSKKELAAALKSFGKGARR